MCGYYCRSAKAKKEIFMDIPQITRELSMYFCKAQIILILNNSSLNIKIIKLYLHPLWGA